MKTNNVYDITITETPNGDKIWLKNGLIHNDNGPAIETSNGTKFWIINARYHRLDGPAMEFNNGERHRKNGPAIECNNGYKEYWYNGYQLINISSDKELKKYIKLLSIS